VPSEDAGPLQRAAELCEAGWFAEASGLLRTLVEHEPTNQQAWSLLARSELGAKRFEHALHAAERAIEFGSASALPRVAAACALLAWRRLTEAVTQAREAVSIDPFDWRALAILARALAREGRDPAEARELVPRMVALAPDQPEVHLTAGYVAAATGDKNAARHAFRRVLELDRGSSAAQHELARIRLRRHANDPTALADAAAGFSRAVLADPEAQQSRRTLELVLRAFLSKTSYLLLIDAWLVGRFSATSSSGSARLLPPLLLAVPAAYAWRFISRLTPRLRRKLFKTLADQPPLRIAAGLEALSVLGIIAAATASSSSRTGLAGAAAVAALIGRVVLHTQVEHATRAVHHRPAQPSIRSSLLWVIAALLGLTAAALLLAAASNGAGPGAIVGALLFAGGAAALVRVVLRRRSQGPV